MSSFSWGIFCFFLSLLSTMVYGFFSPGAPSSLQVCLLAYSSVPLFSFFPISFAYQEKFLTLALYITDSFFFPFCARLIPYSVAIHVDVPLSLPRKFPYHFVNFLSPFYSLCFLFPPDLLCISLSTSYDVVVVVLLLLLLWDRPLWKCWDLSMVAHRKRLAFAWENAEY